MQGGTGEPNQNQTEESPSGRASSSSCTANSLSSRPNIKSVKIMKKKLLPIIFSLLAATSVRADLIWYEGFNYADGPITNSSGGVWAKHSGSSTEPSDAIVRDHKLEVSTSGAGLARADDVNRPLGAPHNATLQPVFSSFTINFTNLPTADGTYFAHFMANNTTFYCRIFAMRGNPTGTSNVFS